MAGARETARVSLAMEALARERFEAMHDAVRTELISGLDDKTRRMVRARVRVCGWLCVQHESRCRLPA